MLQRQDDRQSVMACGGYKFWAHRYRPVRRRAVVTGAGPEHFRWRRITLRKGMATNCDARVRGWRDGIVYGIIMSKPNRECI